MMNAYEVLFYCGDGLFPAYYLIGQIEGDTAEDALRINLARVTQKARLELGIIPDVTDEKIQGSLYLLRENGLVPTRSIR